MMFSATTENVF